MIAARGSSHSPAALLRRCISVSSDRSVPTERLVGIGGDPFYAAAKHRPHACIAGVVYIGHMVEGEDGEEVEIYISMQCRRCPDSR